MKEKIIQETIKSTFESTTFDRETQHKTSCLLPSSVVIKVGSNAIGAIQTFEYTECKLQDGTPGAVGRCSRIFFDKQSIVEVFTGKDDLDDTKFNIDIHYLDRITTLKNCKLDTHHILFNAKSYVVEEEISFTCEGATTVRLPG